MEEKSAPKIGSKDLEIANIWTRKRYIFPLTSLIFVLCITQLIPYSWQSIWGDLKQTDKSPREFRWEHITPNERLEFHDCFDEYHCARLKVPMDWNNPKAKEKVAIAITRMPAKVPITDPRYGGPILINPGGPGMSGIKMLFQRGKQMQNIVDLSTTAPPSLDDNDPDDNNPEAKYFDIIGFDPRGVDNTTPALACFPTAMDRLAWNLQMQAEGSLGSSNDTLPRAWARAKALGESCASESGNGRSIGKHMNTTPVVRDIVAIIEAFGEWRELESRRWISSGVGKKTMKKYAFMYQRNAILKRTRWIPGQEKLLYWGLSYGTSIGTIFAAMYPDKVGRVVLDGIDIPSYYNMTTEPGIRDADKVLDRLILHCFESGSIENCGLFDPTGPEAIKKKLFAILEDVKNNPVAVSASSTRGPEIITSSDVDNLLHLSLYFPLPMAQNLFRALHDLSRGDASWFADLKASSMQSDLSALPKYCERAPPYIPECQTSDVFDNSGGYGIECTDGDDLSHWTKERFIEYWDELKGFSEVMAARKAADTLMCMHWKLRAAWRFTGPFEGKTWHPMLLIGNTFDPTTPLSNAHRLAQGFPGSVVLEQNTLGHCSIAAPSLCTAKTIRQYFQTGMLPPNHTVCNVDEVPFQSYSSSVRLARSIKDSFLLEASRKTTA